MVPTIRTQSVAEHCFNVHRIAMHIARNILNDHDPEVLLAISEYSIRHDDLESVMGDPPSMIKPYIDEDAIERDFSNVIPKMAVSPYVASVVKLADLLDAVHFVSLEMRMGNTMLTKVFDDLSDDALEKAEELGIRHAIYREMENMVRYTYSPEVRRKRK